MPIGEASRIYIRRANTPSCPFCAGKVICYIAEVYTWDMDDDLRLAFQSNQCMHDPSRYAAFFSLQIICESTFLTSNTYGWHHDCNIFVACMKLRSLLILLIITSTPIAACTCLFPDSIGRTVTSPSPDTTGNIWEIVHASLTREPKATAETALRNIHGSHGPEELSFSFDYQEHAPIPF